MYQHIAVAIDFSEQSMKALERALALKKQYDSLLTLVAVVDTKSFGSVEAFDLKYAKQLVVEYKEKLQALKNDCPSSGINILVETGSPKQILTNLDGVDLIVCGATGKTKAEQLMLGSISSSIVRYAKCDVCIVRNE